ncbi:hypothetical protein CMT41_02975 [Colwellia sp. MT41]|uniref:hypothetical protein n=1 Tax=Colwellia sp. MT41 TaxID=58049 RepID=UPI0007175B8E|nr:hypothetical protein [Colwellia sp. MT41]ALO33795.1 hypothetical protein CMT41_02975 [Colwellia sp. MT41]
MKPTSFLITLSIFLIFSFSNSAKGAESQNKKTNITEIVEKLAKEVAALRKELNEEKKKTTENSTNLTKNNQHHLDDIKEYKNSSDILITEKISAIWNGSVKDALLYLFGTLFISGFGMWYSLKGLLVLHIKNNSKEILKKHAQEMNQEHIALLAAVSGQSMHHWWLYYQQPNKDGDIFQRSITTISEMTLKIVKEVPKSHPKHKYLSQFLINSLFYLADTKDKGLLNDRKPIVKDVFEYVEKELIGTPENKRDEKWAEKVDCLCLALDRFELRRPTIIKGYLDEASAFFSDERKAELKTDYDHIYG